MTTDRAQTGDGWLANAWLQKRFRGWEGGKGNQGGREGSSAQAQRGPEPNSSETQHALRSARVAMAGHTGLISSADTRAIQITNSKLQITNYLYI